MFKKPLLPLLLALALGTSSQAADASNIFEWLGALEGEWYLSDTKAQQGSCHFSEEQLENVDVGIAFKYVGKKTTIQEDLLPGTARQMVTMYHCKDIACTNIKATHFCIKMNQPQYLANLEESTANKLVFECDPSTELCNSDENYVYKIIHELSEDGERLTSSYLSKSDKKPIPSTICNFER